MSKRAISIADQVEQMTDEQVEAELLKRRVKAKQQQKKQQKTGAQKVYHARQREKLKLLRERAKQSGSWDRINEQAEQLAAQPAVAGEETDDGRTYSYTSE